MVDLVCGLDLGGTKLLALVADPADVGASEPVAVIKVPRPASDVVAGLAETARTVIEQAEAAAPGRRVTAVGLGAPGLVDRSGVLRYGANLPGVVDLALADELADGLGLPVVVDNDATCAGWAEHERGAARGCNHSITITLGTGIGAGLTVKGEVLRGAHGYAGEPGHMVVDPAGPECRCGRFGCWEQFASGSALGRFGREAVAAGQGVAVLAAAGGTLDDVRGEHVVAAARVGDADARAVMGQFAWWVALGIANLVNVLDSEVVVIGGGLVEAGDLLLEPVRRCYHELLMGADHREVVPIVAATLGERAGAWGAALLAAARVPD
ncbi:MAG TPA: ROK family protein [Acidimicrobiales bacterium]|nr:ROK family protein [Acidimicrobiales bacterium]HRA34846.1 ROK family protein [Acidimicrobiales bacterium]